MTNLLLDFDGPLPADIDWRLMEVCRCLGLRARWCRVGASRRGWHIVLAVSARLSPPVIVALQAILGSDWRREMFNLYRVRRLRRVPASWRDKWNVLYSCKPMRDA
jgi:hypothetical protein